MVRLKHEEKKEDVFPAGAIERETRPKIVDLLLIRLISQVVNSFVQHKRYLGSLVINLICIYNIGKLHLTFQLVYVLRPYEVP